MTDAELLAHDKIGPEVAAKYLQNGTTAQEIRVFVGMWKDKPEGKVTSVDSANTGLQDRRPFGERVSAIVENKSETP